MFQRNQKNCFQDKLFLLAILTLMVMAFPVSSANSSDGDQILFGPIEEDVLLQRMKQPWHLAPHSQQEHHFSAKDTDWQTMIDDYWGPGAQSGHEQLAVLLEWVNLLDDQFACFVNHDVDMEALYTPYLQEVEAGVSRGRFSAIMTYITMSLRNGHTYFYDLNVSTAFPHPGMPLLVGNISYG